MMKEGNEYHVSKETDVRNERKKKKNRWWIFLSLFLILALSGGAVGFHFKENLNYFGENVVINTVHVAGMTVEQATQAVLLKIEEQMKTEWVFQYDGETFPVEVAQVIVEPENVETIVQDIWDQEQSVPLWRRILPMDRLEEQNYTIPIEYNPEAMGQLAEQWHEKWDQEPVNSTLLTNGDSLTVVPAQNGQKVHEEEIFSNLPVSYDAIQNSVMDIPVQIQEAQITEASWGNIGKLSSYSTNYNPGEINRTHNLSLAVDKINGVVLQPGEEFSFNQTVGVRSAAAGYRDAQVISNGAYKPELGGGICQVTSTLYNGVLLAGLQIVERHNHALDVAYLPAGRDATVYYGRQDFRFKNSNQYPVYVGMSLGGGTLTVSLYGNTDEKQNISISTILDQTIPYPTEYEEDETLTEEKVTQNGMNGKVVRSFRNYLDESGAVIHQEALGTSRYQPLARIITRPPENPEEDLETSETSETNGTNGTNGTNEVEMTGSEPASNNDAPLVPEGEGADEEMDVEEVDGEAPNQTVDPVETIDDSQSVPEDVPQVDQDVPEDFDPNIDPFSGMMS